MTIQLPPTSAPGGACSSSTGSPSSTNSTGSASSSHQCDGCASSSGQGDSQQPVRYFNGQVKLALQDLVSDGFGRSIDHTRFYSNQLSDGSSETSHDFHNGYNWMVRPWRHLVDLGGSPQELLVMITPENVCKFKQNGSNYDVQHGRYETLAAASNIFEFTEADGTVFEFHDFTQSTQPKGALKRIVNPNGEVIDFDYNTSGT